MGQAHDVADSRAEPQSVVSVSHTRWSSGYSDTASAGVYLAIAAIREIDVRR